MPTVKCPSGFTFECRRWRLKDMEDLADRAEAAGAGDDLIVGTVGAQWVRTIDPGPYPFVQEGDFVVDWTRVQKPDVLWALFRIRVASWPDDPARGMTAEHYQFDVTCQNCKPPHKFPQMVKLGDLKVRLLPEASAAVIRAGRSFEVKALDGRKIVFDLPTLQQDVELNKYLARFKRKGKAKASDAHAAQTVSIEGIKPDLASRIRYFATLELPDFIHLRNAFSAVGANIITRIDAPCDECKSVTEVKLPLRGSFFMPEDPMEETPPDEEPTEGTEQEEATTSTTTPFSSDSSAPLGTTPGVSSPG